MTREELRAVILRWCLARGYEPRPQAESRSYGGTFFAERVGVRPWEVSNVVRGDWACVKQMRSPVKIAAALELDLREVWPAEAGPLPGLRETPVPPYLLRLHTIGIGLDIPARPEPAEEADLRELLARLPEGQQFVLTKRFGLDGPEMPLEALGVMLGCSRERVRQIEARALHRLRRFLGGPPEPGSEDPRRHLAPWREGRADRHRAQSCLASQAVELERAVVLARCAQTAARAQRSVRSRAATRAGRASSAASPARPIPTPTRGSRAPLRP
jgi:hypothetical protein